MNVPVRSAADISPWRGCSGAAACGHMMFDYRSGSEAIAAVNPWTDRARSLSIFGK